MSSFHINLDIKIILSFRKTIVAHFLSWRLAMWLLLIVRCVREGWHSSYQIFDSSPTAQLQFRRAVDKPGFVTILRVIHIHGSCLLWLSMHNFQINFMKRNGVKWTINKMSNFLSWKYRTCGYNLICISKCAAWSGVLSS